MSGINSGIKQPLRFYDSVTKQNWRRHWIKDSGLVQQEKSGGVNLVICPENIIIPFQVRRKNSANPVTIFELYSYDDLFEIDLMTITPGTFTDHMRVIQTQQADNIVWYPQSSFTSTLPAGLHYVKIGDGISTWYSEIFKVICDFNSEQKTGISHLPVDAQIEQTSSIAWTSGINHYEIILARKPY